MSQPDWKFEAQLGDVNPIDHGGKFLFSDKTGVYAPELEVLELIEGDTEDEYNDDGELETEGDMKWQVHRFILEPCTYGRVVNGEWEPLTEYHPDGVLSDNKFHPGHAAWFAKPESEKANRPQDSTYLSNVASFVGSDLYELIEMFLSDDLSQRALAWIAVADYHGIENLDQYPITFDDRRELEKRYADCEVS